MRTGFSLIELLVGISLASLTLLVVSQQQVTTSKNTKITNQILDSTANLNEILDEIESEIKNIGFGVKKDYLFPNSDFPIESSPTNNNLSFTTRKKTGRTILKDRLLSCPANGSDIEVMSSNGFSVNDKIIISCIGKTVGVSAEITAIDSNLLTINSVISNGTCNFPESLCTVTALEDIEYSIASSNLVRNSENILLNSTINFTYYDSNNSVITTPNATSTKNIRSIRVRLSKTVSPNNKDHTSYLSRLITLDNLLGVTNND